METDKYPAKLQSQIDEARQMKSNGMSGLYDRVKLLEKISNNKSFGDEELLDELMDDVMIVDGHGPFRLALRVLKDFPRRKQWENLGWRKMMNEIVEKDRTANALDRREKNVKPDRPSYEPSPLIQNKLNQNKLEKAEEQINQMQVKVADAEGKARRASEESELRQREVKELKRQLTDLEKARERIQELEQELKAVTRERDELKQLLNTRDVSVVAYA